MLVNISHDLKTPLTVVYGYAEMLLAPELNLAPAVRTKVEKIYAKTRDVLDMLLLFFDLAKMESGELQMEKAKIDVCEICRSELSYKRQFRRNGQKGGRAYKIGRRHGHNRKA